MSDLVQLLTPEGVRVSDDTYDPWVADVDVDALNAIAARIGPLKSDFIDTAA